MSEHIHVADEARSPAPSSLALPQAHAKLPPIVHDVLRSPGQPLASSTRAFMGSRFGHDFADVRVHADESAAESARALNAAAFTVGRHVVFGANRYAPSSRSGRELLGHELAHTIQQRNSSGPGPTQQPRGIFETSAAAAGWAVANGRAISQPLPACGIGLSRAPLYFAEAGREAQEDVTEGKVWRAQHFYDAMLTWTSLKDRPATLALRRALSDVEIGMSKKQERHQESAPVLSEESRIGFRRNALLDIMRTKSVKRGLSEAEAEAQDPDHREQIRLVAEDMKLVQDEFRLRARENALSLLDASSREIAAMLAKYGVMIAAVGAEHIVHYVRVYEGELQNEADKWLETARVANTSGFADAEKMRHRKDLNMTLRRLRALQSEVKRMQIKHPAKAKDASSLVLRSTASLLDPSLADYIPASLAPDHPELKRAKVALVGAWLNAERDHPVLAAYRAGKDDALENVSLDGRDAETPEDLLDVVIPGASSLAKQATGGRSRETSETEDMHAVVTQAIRLLTNVLTAKLALQQDKVSPLELDPIVTVTRAQMLIRRGTVWDVAIEELRREHEGGELAWAVLQVVLNVLALFPPLWPVLIAMAAIDLRAAGKAYVRYGLDQALVGTSLDRAKAISTKTPSLAGFAWALIGAGLDVVGIKAALAQAEALSARVLAADAEAAEAAVRDLNKLGADHGMPQLGEEVAKTRPTATAARPRSSLAPVTEEAFAAKPVRGTSRLDRGKGARPFHHKDPGLVGKQSVSLGAGGAAKPMLAATAAPRSGGELMAKAETMLERLPANHKARDAIARFIQRSQKRLAPIRTQAEAEEVLRGLDTDLEQIRSKYPGAFDPAPPIAPAPVPTGIPPTTATAMSARVRGERVAGMRTRLTEYGARPGRAKQAADLQAALDAAVARGDAENTDLIAESIEEILANERLATRGETFSVDMHDQRVRRAFDEALASPALEGNAEWNAYRELVRERYMVRGHIEIGHTSGRPLTNEVRAQFLAGMRDGTVLPEAAELTRAHLDRAVRRAGGSQAGAVTAGDAIWIDAFSGARLPGPGPNAVLWPAGPTGWGVWRLDHIVERRHGGLDVISNYIAAAQEMHATKTSAMYRFGRAVEALE